MSKPKDNVIRVRFKPDPKEALIGKILDLIYEFADEITCVEAIGIVELVKHELLCDEEDNDDAP